jgi:hypothetical protein
MFTIVRMLSTVTAFFVLQSPTHAGGNLGVRVGVGVRVRVGVPVTVGVLVGVGVGPVMPTV